MTRLPFFFIVTAMVGFVLFHSISIGSLYEWMQGSLRGPSGWFQSHLFVLGWATMLAMGAVYQLINVILNAKIYSEKLAYTQYAVFTAGLAGLLYGFYKADVAIIALFATLSFLGILLFAWNIGHTLFRAAQWNVITISAALAILYLVLTGLLGMAMGINFVTGEWSVWHDRLFGAHIWLGVTGWFGMLITGFSYKLLPMFYLSHNYPTRLQHHTLWLWNAGIVVGVLTFLLDVGFWSLWIAILLLTIATITYNIHLLQIKKYRHKPHPGLGVKWSLYASQALSMFGILLLLYTVIYPDRILHESTVTIAGWVTLGGWISFTILCYASKIIPFLWWTRKYGDRVGQPDTPTMSDLLSDNKVQLGLALIAASMMLLFIGLLLNIMLIVVIGGMVFSLTSIGYMLLLGSVFAN